MKKAIPFVSLFLGVVLLIIAVVLPSGSGDAEFIRLAKMLPAELGELTYIDVDMLRSDERLSSTWDMVQEQFIGEDFYGEDAAKITGFGLAGSQYELWIYVGDFDLSVITSSIEDSSIEFFKYKGINVWTDMYSYSTAIIDGLVFSGSRDDVQMCIDVAEGESSSLYSNKAVQDVIGRLTGGYMLGVMVAGDGESSGDTYGILAVGMSAWRQGDSVIQMQLYKFEEADDVQEFVDMIGAAIPDGYDVKQDNLYLTITGATELPTPEEEAYNSVYDALDYAVYAYYYSNEGALPTIDGTVNIDGYDCQILDICALLISAGGILSEMPEGVAAIDGPDNDNCDSGCAGCSADSHYIWAIDDYGLYSVCVGDACDANGESGFQGVWP